MSGYKVELEWEQARKIIVHGLKKDLQSLNPTGDHSGGWFSPDKEEDLKQIKKMRKAFIRVLTYYTTKDERDWKDET